MEADFFSVTVHDHHGILILNQASTKHFSKPHNLLLNFCPFVFDNCDISLFCVIEGKKNPSLLRSVSHLFFIRDQQFLFITLDFNCKCKPAILETL